MSRALQKKRTRDNILNTADRLFRENGYESVSTRLIAKESGVAVGTVFAHFIDKETLTKALFLSKIDNILAKNPLHDSQSTSGLEFFLIQAELLYYFYNEDRSFSIALLKSAFFDIDFFSSQMSDFIQDISRHMSKELPTHTDEQRLIIAKAWFGFYVLQLTQGLVKKDSNPEDWLDRLAQECKLLLSASH